MELIIGGNVSEMKKKETDTKLGGNGGNGAPGAIVIEHVTNGWVLRLLDPATESEEVFVFTDREQLINEVAKYI